MAAPHPLTAGVTVVVTRHLGPFKLALRGQAPLWWAAERSAALDRNTRTQRRPGGQAGPSRKRRNAPRC